MAIKNRTEVSAAIQAEAAIVGETEYKALLDGNFADNCVFRKDVIGSGNGNGAQNVDFDNLDLINWDATGGDTAISFLNLNAGEVKYLTVTKDPGDEITFVSANTTDVSIRKDYITSDAAYVVYRILSKGIIISVESISVDNDIENIREDLDLGDVDIDWTITLGSGTYLTNNQTYAKQFGRTVCVQGTFSQTSGSYNQTIITLPTGITAPSQNVLFTCINLAGEINYCWLNSSGNIISQLNTASTGLIFNITYLVD